MCIQNLHTHVHSRHYERLHTPVPRFTQLGRLTTNWEVDHHTLGLGVPSKAYSREMCTTTHTDTNTHTHTVTHICVYYCMCVCDLCVTVCVVCVDRDLSLSLLRLNYLFQSLPRKREGELAGGEGRRHGDWRLQDEE